MDETPAQFEARTGKKLIVNTVEVTEEEIRMLLSDELKKLEMDIPFSVKFDREWIGCYGGDKYTREKSWDIFLDGFNERSGFVREHFDGQSVFFDKRLGDALISILEATKKELSGKAKFFLYENKCLHSAKLESLYCNVCKKDTIHYSWEADCGGDSDSECLACLVTLAALTESRK